MFNCNVARGFKHITDGFIQSKTAAISEVIAAAQNTKDARGRWFNDWGICYMRTFAPNSSQPDEIWKSAVTKDSDPASFCVNSKPKSPCNGNGTDWDDLIIAARSYHPGGVNVVLADGSVHRISDEIELQAWQNLASISSADIAGGF